MVGLMVVMTDNGDKMNKTTEKREDKCMHTRAHTLMHKEKAKWCKKKK